MALPSRPAGSIRTPIDITWEDIDLSGATITGTLLPINGSSRPVSGVLSIVDSHTFRWQPALSDVAAGVYRVQFMASFTSGATPEKTFIETWVVAESL